MPKPPKVTDIQSVHIRKLINSTPPVIRDPYDPRKELLQTIPWTLESAISYILKDFDYEKNVDSNTAIALRMLSSTIDRFRELHS